MICACVLAVWSRAACKSLIIDLAKNAMGKGTKRKAVIDLDDNKDKQRQKQGEYRRLLNREA